MLSQNVVFTAPETAEVQPVEVGDPGPHQVLIQTEVSLVSTGTESYMYLGNPEPGSHWARYISYPCSPGYSNVGTVVAAGPEVEGFAEGDRVWSTAVHNQYVPVGTDAPFLLRVPHDVSSEDATWATLAYVVQTGVRRAQHVMGDSAVIIGLGPLGQLAAQFLTAMGLGRVLLIDTVQSRLDLALAHGADAAFCGPASEALDFVLEHNDGELADVVYDVTGHWSVLAQALPLAKTWGKVLLLGDTTFPGKQTLTSDVLTRGVEVVATHASKLPPGEADWTAARQAALFFRYLQRGSMRVSDLFTHRFSPLQAPQVYADLQTKRGETLGVLFDWGQL